jgi:N-acetylmuramoyl-L-alanine amidase
MKIMLNAGHGPNTPGKRTPDGMKEYEFNSAVADYAKKYLNDYKDVTVYFAHSDKKDVPLDERTDNANGKKVDVYVSIHANAFGSGWNSANGIETFVYTTKPKEAYELAKDVQHELIVASKLNDRGVKTANFHELRETAMTAILCECGFMTNKEEAVLLKSDAYRKKIAAAIVKGLASHYKLEKKPAPKPKPVTKPVNKNVFYQVVTGSFNDRSNADARVKELKSKGFDSFIQIKE